MKKKVKKVEEPTKEDEPREQPESAATTEETPSTGMFCGCL